MSNSLSLQIFNSKEQNTKIDHYDTLFPHTKIFHTPFSRTFSFCSAEMLIGCLKVGRTFEIHVTIELMRRYKLMEKHESTQVQGATLQQSRLLKGVINVQQPFYHEVAILSLWAMRSIEPSMSKYLLSLANREKCQSKAVFKGIFAKSNVKECSPLLWAVEWNSLFLAKVAIASGMSPNTLIHTAEFTGYPQERFSLLPERDQAHFKRLFEKATKLEERRELVRLKAVSKVAKVVKKANSASLVTLTALATLNVINQKEELKGKENKSSKEHFSAASATAAQRSASGVAPLQRSGSGVAAVKKSNASAAAAPPKATAAKPPKAPLSASVAHGNAKS